MNGLRILLICNGAVSTSLLASNVKKYSASSDQISAMQLSAFIHENVEVDIILVAPQIKTALSQIKEKNQNAVVEVMESTVYGRMDGKAVFEQAKKIAEHSKKKGEDKVKKLKITLCCNGGVSTKMLCKKIVAAAESHGFEIDCDAHAVAGVETSAEGSDLILVGPQIKFMAKPLQEKLVDIPVEVIDMRDYGAMNGTKIFEDMLAKYKWKERE